MRKEYAKSWYQTNKQNPDFREKRREWKRLWRERNRDHVLIKHREYCKVHRYQKKYGITIAERDALFAANNGLCYICSKCPSEAVDHDHDTGRVRGALCRRCNLLLGIARDDTNVLLSAVDYLSRELVVLPKKKYDHARERFHFEA